MNPHLFDDICTKYFSKMDLVIDIGNSNIVLAVNKNNEWIHSFRYETKDNQPQYYFENGFANLLLEWSIPQKEIKSVTVSSVVPHLNQKIRNATEIVTGLSPIIIDPEFIKNLDMPVPHPNEIGSDLVANAYAAIKIYEKTFHRNRFWNRTYIYHCPSSQRHSWRYHSSRSKKPAFASLSDQTAQLPMVSLSKPLSAIGLNTSHAIQAGIIFGYEGLVNFLIEKIRIELDENYITIATGGISEALGKHYPTSQPCQ